MVWCNVLHPLASCVESVVPLLTRENTGVCFEITGSTADYVALITREVWLVVVTNPCSQQRGDVYVSVD